MWDREFQGYSIEGSQKGIDVKVLGNLWTAQAVTVRCHCFWSTSSPTALTTVEDSLEPHRDCDSFIWFVFVNTRVEFGNYYENSNRYCWMNECILRLNFVVAAPIPLNVWVSVELPQTLPSAVQGAGLCCVRPTLIYTD